MAPLLVDTAYRDTLWVELVDVETGQGSQKENFQETGRILRREYYAYCNGLGPDECMCVSTKSNLV